MKNTIFISLGTFLIISSLFGVMYSVRAGNAQWIYYRSKYGAESKKALEVVTDNCFKAYTLYPHNYYFSILVAERNYYEQSDNSGPGIDVRLSNSERWCDLGLQQNFHKSQLRRLKTRFLAERSVKEAISFWEDYTTWQFWEPHNHAVMADLYLKNGNFEEASKSIQYVKGSIHYKDSVKRFNEAWDKEMQLPDLEQIMK